MRISFHVSGKPRTKGNFKPFKNKKTGKTCLVPPKAANDWEELVKVMALIATEADARNGGGGWPASSPVYVWMYFNFVRPKSHHVSNDKSKPVKESSPLQPTGREGDIDKLARAVLDGITKVIVDDDSQVVGLTATKSFGRTEGVTVCVEDCVGGLA